MFHDVFHVSLLKQNPSNDKVKNENNETLIEASVKRQSTTEYEVENIVDNRIVAANELSEDSAADLYYLVH